MIKVKQTSEEASPRRFLAAGPQNVSTVNTNKKQQVFKRSLETTEETRNRMFHMWLRQESNMKHWGCFWREALCLIYNYRHDSRCVYYIMLQ